ncbi:hypothetical protein B0H16DRAFT_1467413 [Mycena metata]|uniref:Uncharacterized protein n=1 Tax=Mycena metata TaxID=1033252 RepID=A0AAD7I5T8_9AGAR|nr:hypothetical protein B0H16DRAFT_1467413 [Mycena metata]
MARKKKNLPPGRKSDFMDEKADWLDTFKDTILGAGREEIGAEYTEITNRFILRYGYDLPFTENVVGDPTLNPPVIPVATTEEEKTRRAEIRSTLREKLSNWYRSRYRNKKSNAGALKQVLQAMQSMTGKSQRPRRKDALKLYMKLHYEQRVKPAFDAIWAKTKDSVPATMHVSMMQDYVRTCWEGETEDFKKGVEDQSTAMHEEAMNKWREGRQWESFSAEEYHDALETLEDVAIPLADALAERLGMHIVILAVGPVGSEEGGVRLRTVFSDTAEGAISKTWPAFDHQGFTAMEASITRYGNAFFTKAECNARAWPPLLPDLLQMDEGTPAPPPPPAPPVDGSAPAPPPPPATSAAPPPPPPPPASGTAPPPPPTTTTALVLGDAAEKSNAPTDGIDRSEWDPNLVEVYAYLSSKKWDELLARLIQFEWSNFFHDEMAKIQKITHRPEEIGEWMKRHRVLDDFPLNQALTPAFGERLLPWWQDLGPKDRWKDVQGMEAPPQEEEQYGIPPKWKGTVQYGRNGIQLIVLALAWWGQDIWNQGSADGLGGGEKALEAAADWQRLSQDVSWFLFAGQRERDPEWEAAPETENTTAKKGRGKGKGRGKKKDKEGPEKEKDETGTETETTAKKRKNVPAEGEDTAAKPKRRRRSGADTPADTPAVDQPRPRPRLLRGSGKGGNTSTVVPETSVSTTPAAETPTADTVGNHGGGAPVDPAIVNATVNAVPETSVSTTPAAETPTADTVGNHGGGAPVDPAIVNATVNAVPETSVSTTPAADTPIADTVGNHSGGAPVDPAIVNATVNAAVIEPTATVNGMDVDPATTVNLDTAIHGNSARSPTASVDPSSIVGDRAIAAPTSSIDTANPVNSAVEPATTVDLSLIVPANPSVELATTVDPSLILPRTQPDVEDGPAKDDAMDVDFDDMDGLTAEERAEMLADPDADDEA